MIRFVSLIVLAAVLVGTTASGEQQKQVAVTEGWIKAPAAGATSAAAFLIIENPTMYDVYVTEVSTDVAGKVELRRAAKTPEAKAEALTSITAPAYGSVKMTPEGIQLMLLELKRPLKVGETVTLLLSTDSGSALIAEAQVREK